MKPRPIDFLLVIMVNISWVFLFAIIKINCLTTLRPKHSDGISVGRMLTKATNHWGSNLHWRSKGKALDPKNAVLLAKHGGGSIMLWGCFAASGTRVLHKADGIISRTTSTFFNFTSNQQMTYTVKKIRKFRGPFTVDLLRIRSVLRNTESLLLRKAEFSPPARIFRRHYFQCGQCLPKFLQVTRKVGNRLVVWNENENGVPPCSPSYIKLVSIGSW